MGLPLTPPTETGRPSTAAEGEIFSALENQWAPGERSLDLPGAARIRTPLRRWHRWTVRLGYSIPFLLLVALSSSTRAGRSENDSLVARVFSLSWNRVDVHWLQAIFPPVSSFLAVVIPGGTLGLAIAGSVAAGILVQRVIEITVQRGIPRTTAILLVTALVANPLFFYTASHNLAGFIALALAALGASHMARFINYGDTQAGFHAGVLLLLAALSDATGPIYVFAIVLVSPLLRIGRRHGQRGRWANVLVVAFPTLAGLSAVVVLNLIFTGSPAGAGGLAGWPEIARRLVTLPGQLVSATGILLLGSIASAGIVSAASRTVAPLVGATVILFEFCTVYLLGLATFGLNDGAFMLIGALAITLLPVPRGWLSVNASNLIALLQLAILWIVALENPVIHGWTVNLVRSAVSLFV